MVVQNEFFGKKMNVSKRKKVVLSIEKKLEALSRLDQGETLKNIANELGVGIVTVGDWKRKRKELEAWYVQKASASGLGERKTMKRSVFENVGEALFQWYNVQHKIGAPITGPILQEKALIFHKRFNPGEEDKFTASNGWLDRWKSRYGVKQLNINVEKQISEEEYTYPFQQEFTDYINKEKLKKDQIYCCAETILNFKMLPKKLLSSKEENVIAELEENNDKLTLFICSNASGTHKLPLICIGKFVKPEELKQNLTIPVKYRHQKSGWVDQDLIKTWYSEEFLPSIRKFLEQSGLPNKAVLLMDNISSHPPPEELQNENFKVFSYPTYDTNSVQVMNHSVIESLKLIYRYRLLQSFLLEGNKDEETVQRHFLLGGIIDEQEAIEHFSRLSIVDVVYLLAGAWYEVQSTTISKCWRNLLGELFQEEVNEEETEEENENIFHLIQCLPGCEDMTKSDILEWIRKDHVEDITVEDIAARTASNITNPSEIISNREMDVKEEQDVSMMFNITHSEAAVALEAALHYVQRQHTATSRDVAVLKKWRDYAIKHLE